MNELKVGFSRVNVNPPLGIGVCGYYIPGFAKGFLDDLQQPTVIEFPPLSTFTAPALIDMVVVW